METQTIQPTGCCEPFDPKPWESTQIVWTDKLFVKAHVTSFLHIPLNIDRKMKSNMEIIDKACARSKDQIILTDEKSLWGADIYIAVSDKIAEANMTTISGTFLSKVFEGPYHEVGHWVKEMTEYAKNTNKIVKKLYFYYTTCPKCAKAYGKNYVVLLAQID